MRTKKCGYLLTTVFAMMMIFSGFGFDMALNGEVTDIKATVSPTDYTGHCPKLLIFTGRITVRMDKTGKYRYRWIASDGGFGPVQGGTIKRNGSIVIKSEWLLGGDGNVYKNYWKQIQILPNHYEINSHHAYIRPLKSSNKAFFTLNCVKEVKKDFRINEVTRVMLPSYEISGRIATNPALGCLSCLEGRKVKIILRKGSVVTNHIFTLDHNSSYNYRFKSPFITPGTYTITIVKGPPDQANYGNDLNPCFGGVNPASRTVTLTTANKKKLNQDFQIAFSLRWGGGALCW